MAHALASRSALALSLPRGGSSRRKSRGCRPAVPRAGLNTDKSYNCVVNKEGVIISEDIPSGTYEVSAWWAGATGSSDEGDAPLAPRCDSENQRGCEVRCEMTAEGELVCEGLESGTYRVINAKEAEANCEVADGAFVPSLGCVGEPNRALVARAGLVGAGEVLLGVLQRALQRAGVDGPARGLAELLQRAAHQTVGAPACLGVCVLVQQDLCVQLGRGWAFAQQEVLGLGGDLRRDPLAELGHAPVELLSRRREALASSAELRDGVQVQAQAARLVGQPDEVVDRTRRSALAQDAIERGGRERVAPHATLAAPVARAELDEVRVDSGDRSNQDFAAAQLVGLGGKGRGSEGHRGRQQQRGGLHGLWSVRWSRVECYEVAPERCLRFSRAANNQRP